MKTKLSLILFISAFTLIPIPCFGETLSKSQIQERFNEANALFKEGLEISESDEEKSKALFDECLIRYESIVKSGGIENCQLYYNIGNAHYMRKELGYAILNYRRALALNPSHFLTLKNLQVARAKVKTSTESSSNSAALWQFVGWHEAVPQRWRFGLLQLSVLLIGILCIMRWKKLVKKHRGQRIFIGFAIVGAVSILSLAIEKSSRSEAEAVIVVDSVVGRKGPHGYSYQESFTQALSAGVEVQFVEEREGWSLVQFSDGRSTWIPNSTFERISK